MFFDARFSVRGEKRVSPLRSTMSRCAASVEMTTFLWGVKSENKQRQQQIPTG
jgi:hypothetical protein